MSLAVQNGGQFFREGGVVGANGFGFGGKAVIGKVRPVWQRIGLLQWQLKPPGNTGRYGSNRGLSLGCQTAEGV